MCFPAGSDSKESASSAGDLSSIPGLGRSLEEGNGYSCQYFCLENSMDRGAWRAIVHGVAKSWTWLSDFHFHGVQKPNKYISALNGINLKDANPCSSSQHDSGFPIKALVLLFSADSAYSQVKTIKSRKCVSVLSSNWFFSCFCFCSLFIVFRKFLFENIFP